MFTGIVETIGRVVALEPGPELTRLTLEAPEVTKGVKLGDSVAVNGCCLTVVAFDARTLAFDAIQETLDKTSIGLLQVGSRANLERALPAGGRLDGHIVQGHVDGTGTVVELERKGDDVRLFLACGPEVSEYLVPKGSVAIDGVSLTVVRAREDGFDVALIPHTLEVTTLGKLESGDRVNLEADVLGKYVKKYLDRIQG
jgi:riboflavin synthase